MRSRSALLGVGALCLLGVGCDDSSPPPGPGGMCEAPAPLACATASGDAVPASMGGTTVGGTDDFGGSSCGRGGDGVPDVAFSWTAPTAGRYSIDTIGSDFDTVLSIRRGCGGEEIACNDDITRGSNIQSVLTVELEACETIVIVVDGFDESAVGQVRVAVAGRESICDDGADNDGDGLADCDDPDCFSLTCNGGDDWPADWQAFEWEVLERTNAARAAGANCGGDEFGPAGPLEMDAVISEASRGHSLDMGEQNYFEHESLDGREFSDRMSAVGFAGAGPWGENIAAGQRTAAAVVQGWMESPGHCRNIMNPDYNVIGIGYAFVESSDFGEYWTQNFAGSH